MRTILHKADTRGKADHGWLKSHHTFSFANYYDPERLGFGALRVLNDDAVAPGQGFGTHSHRDMEIISIPLEGALSHRDSTGGVGVIRKGEVQVMSAGTGVAHSEFNASEFDPVAFLQIWVIPRERGVKPRYEQKYFDASERLDRFQLLVSPDHRDGSLAIHQDAYFSLAELSEGRRIPYKWYRPGNGTYFFVIRGTVRVGDQLLNERDGAGIQGVTEIDIEALETSELLAMEVPLELH